jgi:uncharacterized protein CbrC (UPF0167 family)
MGKTRITECVKNLSEEIMATMPRPYTEDVIREVFDRIPQNPAWRQRYDNEVAALGAAVVHQWGGQWIARKLGWQRARAVALKNHPLIAGYTKLIAGVAQEKG